MSCLYSSDFETMVHWLKANIGTGIFAIPDAFKNAGLWMGTIALPIMAIVSTHCMQLLVCKYAQSIVVLITVVIL